MNNYSSQEQFKFFSSLSIIILILKCQNIEMNKNVIPIKNLNLNYKQYLSKNCSLIGYKIGNLVILNKLGQGAFGSVFSAVQETTKNIFAVKVIDLQQIQNQQDSTIKKIKLRLARTQHEIMLKCDSKNLIKCYQVFENKSLRILVIQYCNEGCLSSKINKMKRIQENQAIQILKHILNGLSELHRHGIIHRDLKPQNILIHDGIYKLADFGFSKQLQSNDYQNEIKQTNLGTLLTMAPQIIQRKQYGLQADIWSIGIIYYKMLFGKYPFQCFSKKDYLYEIKTKDLFKGNNANKNISISNQSKQFIKDCLCIKSQDRLNWKNIINHKLFKPSNSLISSKSSVNDISINQIKINQINQDYLFQEKQNLSIDRFAPTSQTIKAFPMKSQQLRKTQQQSDCLFESKFQDLWPKQTNFQCLRVEFIISQIVQILQYSSSDFSESRQIIEINYLIIVRCFQDICWRYRQVQKRKSKLMPNFLKIIQKWYKKVNEKLDIYQKKLKQKEQELVEIVKNKFFQFFKEQKLKQKEIYFNGLKSKAIEGQCLGLYNRDDQVIYTQKLILQNYEMISNQKEISKQALIYIKNYDKICKLRLKDVGEAYFGSYVKNEFVKQ